MRVPVYILAGGQSRRFGSDKARALVDGQPLITRIARSVQPVATRLTVVAARAGAYDDLGLRTIADLHPGKGPMAGLEAALADCPEPWMVLLSCDLLDPQPRWIERLLAAPTGEAVAVAFRHSHWEPLIALYHHRSLPAVRDRVAGGQLRMQALLDEVHAIAVDLPPDWPSRTQANTPADLDQSRKDTPMSDTQPKEAKLPATYRSFVQKFPELGRAHEQIAKAAEEAGPLDRKTCHLVKIGLSVGAGLESATRSHVRRAMEAGATEQEVEQAILLAFNTLGFPRMVMAWQWAHQQFERDRAERA